MSTQCPKCQTENTEDSQFCKKCATPLEADIGPTKTIEVPTEELTSGSTFAGRYQIIEELGKGGMGRVYKVLDKETKERIALKLIKPEIASDRKTIERFKNELTTARKIRHKNVCGMYYLGENQTRPYITMEFISGEDLKSSIRRFGNLPIGKAISIAKQICEGLEEAHNLGIVHRDLKPNNIMIDDNGNARIMDFGIARTVKDKGITGTGVMIGTPEYMSPEQAETKEVDKRSDIYSLGVILYEMTTGHLPFEGDTPLAVAMKHKAESPKDPKELNPQIPDDLSGVILKCLEKNKESRYQSASDVKIELEKIKQGLPTTERAEPKTKPLTSREITVRFNLKKVLIPSLVILLAVATGLFFLLKKGPDFESNRVVVAEFLNQTGDSSLDPIGRRVAETVSQGLETIGLFEIAPLAKFDLKPKKSPTEKYFRQIAKIAESAIVVAGEYYLQGENLVFLSKIYDSLEQKQLSSPGEVTGQTKGLSQALEKLRNSLMSAVLRTHDPRVEMWQKISPYTPQYEALLEFMRGIDLFWRGQDLQSIKNFSRAEEIDPDYFLAVFFALVANSRIRNFSEIERYTEIIKKFPSLSPGERYLIDYLNAFEEGDLEGDYLIWQKLDALAPGTMFSFLLAQSALFTNRPNTVIEALKRLNPESIYVDGIVDYWMSLTLAYHMTDNYKKELKAALKAQRQYPQMWEPLLFRVRALSALGRLDNVHEILEDNSAKPMTSLWYPAKLMYEAGEEFKTHGHLDAAAEMYEQALLWLRNRSQEEGMSDDMKLYYAWSLLDTQKLEEAESVFRDLSDSNPGNLNYLGALGVVVARRGSEEKILRITEKLKNWDKPYSFGEHTYWQAAIAASLGEKDRAVTLLQAALEQGYLYANLYCRSTLEPLWNYAPFVELIKPRD